MSESSELQSVHWSSADLFPRKQKKERNDQNKLIYYEMIE